MTRRFSRNYGYDPSIGSEPITEDAPEALRFDFIRTALDPVTFVDYPDYGNPEGRPLDVMRLGAQLHVICRKDPSESLYEFRHCVDEVEGLLRGCPWYHFFDAVEHIGRELQNAQPSPPIDPIQCHQQFGFDSYRSKVNELFADHRVTWRLNVDSQLERETPTPLAQAIETVAEALAAGFEPASVAFHKARGFLTTRPLDPENAIKEIVSSVESVGRSIYPGTTTLGDVAKEMRKAGFPPLLASLIDKFWGFASAEPGVRHGGAITPKVELADADFCLLVGTALIRYLIDRSAASQDRR
jgi:hypothetical protein